MLRSVRFAIALAGVLAATHPIYADPLPATAPDLAQATAPTQAPAWSSSPVAPASAGFGKNIVAVGLGWG